MQNSTNRKPKFFILDENSIERLKIKARNLERKLRKSNNPITHNDAMNHIAKKYGFDSWKSLSHVYDHENEDTTVSSFTNNKHSDRQLIGAYYRANNINPKNIKNQIHLAFFRNTFDFGSIEPKILLEKYGFIIDDSVHDYLLNQTPYYEDLLDTPEHAPFDYIVRLIGIDTDSYEDALNFFLSSVSDLPLKSPPDEYNTLWINGKVSSIERDRLEERFSLRTMKLEYIAPYIAMPEIIWKNLYS